MHMFSLPASELEQWTDCDVSCSMHPVNLGALSSLNLRAWMSRCITFLIFATVGLMRALPLAKLYVAPQPQLRLDMALHEVLRDGSEDWAARAARAEAAPGAQQSQLWSMLMGSSETPLGEVQKKTRRTFLAQEEQTMQLRCITTKDHDSFAHQLLASRERCLKSCTLCPGGINTRDDLASRIAVVFVMHGWSILALLALGHHSVGSPAREWTLTPNMP